MIIKRIVCFALLLALAVTAIPAAYANTTSAGRAASIVTLPGSGIHPKLITAGGVITQDMPAGNFVTEARAAGTPLAMVNGAYFNAYYDRGAARSFPGNCPNTWHTLISDGNILRTGGGITLGFTSDGKWLIDTITLTMSLSVDNGREYPIWGVNSHVGVADSRHIYTPQMGLPVPVTAAATVFTVRNGVIEKKETGLSQVTAPSGTYVMVFGPDAYNVDARWGNQLEVGMAVDLQRKITPSRAAKTADWEKVTFAVSAGPILLLDGVDVSGNTTLNSAFTSERHRGGAQRTFIGVTANNGLVIGAASTTYADAAATLKARGCVDAMALDGGASSFLYSNGSTLRSAGRQLNNVIAFMSGGASAPTATPGINIIPTVSTVIVDGKETGFEAYSIDDSNFFRLRDLAFAVNGTQKQFSVGLDEATKAIALTSGQSYMPVGGELEGTATAAKAATAVPSASVIYKDGEKLELTAYNIGGSNYFRLRDIMSAFNINVGFDDATKNLTINTSLPY